MFNRIAHLLVGGVFVSISGDDKMRFVNVMVKNSINLWGYRKKGEKILVAMRIKDFHKLRKLRRRYNVNISIYKKIGRPFLVNKIRKRPGILIGGLVSIFLYVYLFCCFWVVDVKNNDVENAAYSDEEILEVARDLGLYESAFRVQVQERSFANQMMMKLPKLNWVTVNTYGSRAEIDIKYNLEKPIVENDERTCDIVASKSGTIVKLEVSQGLPVVGLGQAVHEGEVLVSGSWDSNRNEPEWFQSDDPTLYYANSRAKIFAEVEERMSFRIAKVETLEKGIDEFDRYKFDFFGLKIPISFSLLSEGDYIFSSEKNDFYIFDTKLPIHFEEETLTKIEKYENEISLAEANLKAKNYFNTQINTLSDGEKIVKVYDLEVIEFADYYLATQRYIAVKNIAIQSNFR